MFVCSIPAKEKALDQKGPPNKSYYVISTFVSQTPIYVNKAIDYYYEKYKTFINLANQKITSNIIQQNRNVLSISEMLQKAYTTYNTQTSLNWQSLQAQNTAMLQAKIQQFNQYTKQLAEAGEKSFAFRDFLQQMSYNSTINYDEIPGSVNIGSIQQLIDSFLNISTESTKALGGARSALFGEIFEQGVNTSILENSKNILGYIQTGNSKSVLPGGIVGKGKSDGMFFVDINTDGGLIKNSTTKGEIAVTKNNNIELEASQIFDLGNDGLNNALNMYSKENNIRGGMLGITNKSWVGKTGSFGNFAYSAAQIRSRRLPEGEISKYFHYQEDFNDYNSYIVSKYLINILGVYNGIVATGDEIMPTYVWLANLYNSFRTIRHASSLITSTVSASSGVKYDVHNKLIIAKTK